MKNKQQNKVVRWWRSAAAAVLCVVSLAALLHSLPLYAQDVEVEKAYKIKVAYIYNFARYIRWPEAAFADADAPFVIGFLGDAPFGDTLQLLAETRKVHDRHIVVRRFKTPQDYTPCQMLFVTQTVSAAELREIVDLTKGQNVLIVGESPGFAGQGAGINFFYDETDDTIGFEINVDSLKRRHLTVDARLLKLARIEGGG